MRVSIALLTVAVVSFAGCASDTAAGPGTSASKGTPIRTVPRETTTTAGPDTSPFQTAYPTLPSVTAAPPTWAPVGWQTDDVERFTSIVEEELDALGADATVVVERGFASLDSGTRIPLTTLALRLAPLPTDTWRGEISTFLVTALRPTSPDDIADFTTAAPLLRLMVGEPEALGVTASQVVSQEIAPGLLAAVVVDAPDRKVFVSPAQADLWGKTAAELVFTAAGQTLAVPETPERDDIYTSLTDDVYASARILDPSTVVENVPADGVFVLIPNTDVFLAVNVDRSLDEATLLGLVRQMDDDFTNGSDPASDQLYWWHDGIIEMIPLVDGKLQFPPALADIVGG